VAYAALRRQPAMLAGRLDVLSELPALREQRRQIQARRTAPLHSLARWLEPAPSPLEVLYQQRRLQRLLSAAPAEER
jgi:hypothetical protein